MNCLFTSFFIQLGRHDSQFADFIHFGFHGFLTSKTCSDLSEICTIRGRISTMSTIIKREKRKPYPYLIIDNASLKSAVEFSLNYQQQKVDTSANYFFPFICFVIFVLVTYKFSGKCYLIFFLIIMH